MRKYFQKVIFCILIFIFLVLIVDCLNCQQESVVILREFARLLREGTDSEIISYFVHHREIWLDYFHDTIYYTSEFEKISIRADLNQSFMTFKWRDSGNLHKRLLKIAESRGGTDYVLWQFVEYVIVHYR